MLANVATDGFAVVPLLDDRTVCSLLELYRSIDLAPGHAFHASAASTDRHEARSIHDALVASVGPALSDLLPHYEPFLASFLSKGAETGSVISFHQDLSYTDERSDRTVVAWIPLVEVTARSGALSVVAGSHRWTSGCRPSGLDPLPTEALQRELGDLAIEVAVGPGDAILYDAGTVHGSPPNTSDRPRPAVGIAMHETGRPLVHVHAVDGGTLRTFDVDTSYYVDAGLATIPEGYEERPGWAEPVTEAHLRRAMSTTIGSTP